MTRLERLVTAVAVALALAIGLPLPQAAQAHDAVAYYPYRWAPSAVVHYGFQSGYPTDDRRFRITDGKEAWNNATSGPEPSFFGFLADQNFGNPRFGGDTNWFGGACYVTNNSVHWTNLDYRGTSSAGLTRWCVTAGQVIRFTVEIDSTRSNWYTGTATTIPSNQVDLWSVATHEFGHVSGFAPQPEFHYPAAECPNNNNNETMCGTIPLGTAGMRTLGTHDIHTLDAAYFTVTPPPGDPCVWQSFGNQSTCDGLGRNQLINLGCSETAVDTRNLGTVAQISLMYSSKCRTVTARMKLNGIPPAGFNCYVKLERLSGSPHDVYRSAGVTNDWGYTLSLDDAGVTSSAWGYCQWGAGGPVYTASTIAY